MAAFPCALAGPSLAEEDFGPVNFVLWNNGPGQSFNVDDWMRANARIGMKGFGSISLFTPNPDRIKETLDTAAAARPRETVIVLTALALDIADAEIFAGMMRNFDASLEETAFAGALVLVDAPQCRVLQPP